MTNNVYLVWLEWAERCFRVDDAGMRLLKSLVPAGSTVIRARSEASFLRVLPRATHAIVWEFRREWFARAPRLKLLATPAAGKELIPTEGPEGVTVHFGGFHGEIMAESAVGFMMAWARGFFTVRQAPTGWPRAWLSDKCYTLAGTRAVVAGYGRIGKAIGRKLASLGVEVFGLTRRGLQKDGAPVETGLKSVLKTADWFVMALPSTTGTDDFLDAKRLAALPRKCVVVNIGRGNSIDEVALVEALRAGRLAGAYLDVCKMEPTAVRRQKTPTAALDPMRPDVPNLVLMPHASAFAPQYVGLCFKELKDEGLI